MLFSEIIGQAHIKKHLKTIADSGRIPHAQLFVGPEGSGTLPMALAYARYLLCENTKMNGNNNSCHLKVQSLSHPDLHFTFPVITSKSVKTKPISDDYLKEWRQFLKTQPYSNLFDWLKLLDTSNKQGQIGVNEAQSIVQKLTLKSYEGAYKVLVVWMAEKMNSSCANKLLKLIEEPPSQTIIILVAEDEEQIIETIRSRCQILHFPPLAQNAIIDALITKHDISSSEASKIAYQSQGNYNKALSLLHQNGEELVFEEWFITWVRAAFKAKGNKKVIKELLTWSENIAKSGREVQKKFLGFCLTYFRQALLLNYNANDLVYMTPKTESFQLNKFAPFIHESNILEILETLESAIYHIERNGNAKIIFTDVSIKLTRLLHKKSQV